MREFAVALTGLLLLAPAALALDVSVHQFCDDVGVRPSLEAKPVSMQPGRIIVDMGVFQPRLTARRTKSATVGDTVSVIHNRGQSITLEHVGSGKDITIQLR